ncbi:MAG: hypothetical protein EZS28_002778 [Streblomastix strix]|uniref:Uncharacterized protein n=1 Tax=Streblomastix strix TaxID=222440 RepID=A0A5J4X3Z5_9EUKA|nr:MAG: hypothetical protein EZS28_002778 [Streblomastix strix]
MLRSVYASLINGSETQNQRMGAATWIDLPFFSGSNDGEKLFKQPLQARGLSYKDKLFVKCNRLKIFRQLSQESTMRFSSFAQVHGIPRTIDPFRPKPLFEQILQTIQYRRAIAAILVTEFNVARLAELHRATQFCASKDEFIQTI